MIVRRLWMDPAPWSKRSSRASCFAAYGRWLIKVITVAVVGTACALATACDGGHDDLDARSSAGQNTPMLPGTRHAASAPRSAGAQRFATADGPQSHDASEPLLPPIMHTAD